MKLIRYYQTLQQEKKYDRMWNMHVGRRKINLDDKKKKASFSGDIMNMFFGVGEMSTTSKK